LVVGICWAVFFVLLVSVGFGCGCLLCCCPCLLGFMGWGGLQIVLLWLQLGCCMVGVKGWLLLSFLSF